MKYAVMTDLGVMICISSFIKTGSVNREDTQARSHKPTSGQEAKN
jgi:hypothetical protein